MEDGTGTGQLLCPGPDGFPILLQLRLAGGDEFGKFSFGFKFDFQFSDVEVFRVAQFPQENRVHQLGNALRDFASVGLFCDFKENDLGGSLSVDEVEQITDGLVVQLFLKQVSELAADDCAILQGVAEVLCERTLAGAKETRYPHADAFSWIGGSLSDGFEELVVLCTDTIGSDVFRDFGVDRLLVRLIDLNDLFDLAAEVTSQQFANGLHVCVLCLSRRF